MNRKINCAWPSGQVFLFSDLAGFSGNQRIPGLLLL